MPNQQGANLLQLKTKLEEARSILRDMGMPAKQSNERSALTLLALLGLPPNAPWREASAPEKGVTEIMDFVAEHYDRKYAPNTRETFRRESLQQFVQAGLVELNPDRSITSRHTVYKVSNATLQLLHTFGTDEWPERLHMYLAKAGGQNQLLKLIVEQFCPQFTPGGRVLYLGDAKQKEKHFSREELSGLGVQVDEHGKMPDVVVHHVEKNWLVLIEAVTSHGPVNAKRRAELRELFKDSRAGLVYVTAFMNRRSMSRYLTEISCETEVWVAEEPTHLIHFNGERFLGPYDDKASTG
jgi:hypothetical protein